LPFPSILNYGRRNNFGNRQGGINFRSESGSGEDEEGLIYAKDTNLKRKN